MIKKAMIFSIVFSSAVIVGNQAQADQVQSILSCRKIVENDKRLACFDSVSEKLLNSVIGQDSIKNPKPTRKEKVANFGKTQLRTSPVKKVREEHKEEEKKELKEVRLKVVRFVYTASKKFVVFMENGQIWKQKDGGRIRLPKGEFEVKIKKGMIGGYNMIVPTKKSIIKVKRLK